MKSRVPQGSILGPILFLIYVNDMSDVISTNKLAIFANDSKFYAIIDRVEKFNSLQDELSAFWEWSSINELHFQLEKCENLQISRKLNSTNREYHINGIAMNIVSIEKDLGILVCKDLKWNHHIK